MLIRNLFDPGSGSREGKIQIRNKHPVSSTLVFMKLLCSFDKKVHFLYAGGKDAFDVNG